MASVIEYLEDRIERSYPLAIGLVCTTLTAWAAPWAFSGMVKANWKSENIYSSAFNMAAVATPFLFTFYTIFVTTETGFIGRLKRGSAYRSTVNFTLRAIWLGALTSVLSLPLTVVSPTPVSHTDPWTWIVAGWVGIVAWTAAAFVRAARQFGIFISAHAET